MVLRQRLWRPFALSIAVLSLLLLHTSLSNADADFESVHVDPQLEDMSGRYGDPKGKYWHESVFHPHYDGRFTDHTLPYEEQKANLSLLIQSYLFSMADLGAETWIIHGTLLGWWWNRRSLPWDSDVDVQMTATTVGFLASYYNMTVHTYGKKQYMLEINPGYADGSFEDKLNVIDGRWIDIHTGLFIDITAIRAKLGTEGKIVASKDRHEEQVGDLFPLRDSLFEGMPVKIPYNYMEILADEYGRKALTKLEHARHRFNTTSMEWVPMNSASLPEVKCGGNWRHCAQYDQRKGGRG